MVVNLDYLFSLEVVNEKIRYFLIISPLTREGKYVIDS